MTRFQFSFRPRLLDAMQGYNRALFMQDLSAGLTVGVVALPLAMAFAIASGVKPEAGIFTAIIAGFLISVLGGTRVQIGGPAGAFIVIIYGIIEKYGLANLLISTIFAGILLFAMGMFRLGSLIRFIPVAIVIGFTNGIAILIALSQLKDFLGLKIDKMPGDFFAQVYTIGSNIDDASLASIGLGTVSLLIIFAWPKLFQQEIAADGESRRVYKLLKAIPGTIVVLALGTVAVGVFQLPVETIGTRFGGIPQALPSFSLPVFSWGLVKQLFPPTLTIALLGAVESLLCARVTDSMINDRHDPNQELMAQGVANFVVPFFGGIPATGTIARTVTNVRCGSVSPVSGIVHALTLLAIVLIAAPLAQNIPLTTLAAILLFVAFNMGEWREFLRLRHFSMNYRIVMVMTFLLTVIFDLTVAVEVGLFLACIFFIYRISSLTRIEQISNAALPQAPPQGTAVYAIFGSLFFGAVDKVERLIEPGATPPRILILELHQLINLDTTGLEALEILYKTLKKHSGSLIICGANSQPLSLMDRSHFLDRIGRENCLPSLQEAIQRAHDTDPD